MKTYLMTAAASGLMALAARAPADDAGSTPSAVEAATLHKDLVIGGFTFQVKVPYAEGHQLNVAEASVINQTYAENVRNNVAGKIKAAKEAWLKTEGNTEENFSLDTIMVDVGEGQPQITLRQSLTEYADGYEFVVRTGRTAEPADPVQREARSMARETLADAFRENNIKRKDLEDDVYEAALNELAQSADIQKEAKRRVDTRLKIGAGSGLDLSALLGKGSAPAEGATE